MTASASPRPTTPDAGLAGLDDIENDSPLSELGDIAFDSDFDSDLDPAKPASEVQPRQKKQRHSTGAELAAATSPSQEDYAKENGAAGSHEQGDHDTTSNTEADGERPSKRRRIRDTTPECGPRLKPVSPPWKRVEAEGPSTIIDGGRRKSGRLATTPLSERPNGDNRRARRKASPATPLVSSTRQTPTTSQPPQRSGQKLPKKGELKLPRTATKQSQPRETKAPARDRKSVV